MGGTWQTEIKDFFLLDHLAESFFIASLGSSSPSTLVLVSPLSFIIVIIVIIVSVMIGEFISLALLIFLCG